MSKPKPTKPKFPDFLNHEKTVTYIIEKARSVLGDVRSDLQQLFERKPYLAEEIHNAHSITTIIRSLHSTLKRVEEVEKQVADNDFGKGYNFYCRPLGTDAAPCCFVCEAHKEGFIIDGKKHMHSMTNIAAFVDSKEDGDIIANEVFVGRAWLDYRPNYPNRIQVKIGACDKHVNNLAYLSRLTSIRHNVIRKRDVQEAQLVEI